jgi:hypothetical protein
MNYQSLTIRKAIDRLNRTFFLPSLQREFVWTDKQLIRLFDSIMRGYPIGSFLFWQPRDSSVGRLSAYKFLDEISDDSVHNTPASLNGVSRPVFVLDGQQRLTALNIGLRGTYHAKDKYKWWNNKDAWKRKRLYLDLLFVPKSDDTEEDTIEATYRFAFHEQPPAITKRSCWFEVGKILQCVSSTSVTAKANDLIRKIPGHPGRAARERLRQNLRRLHQAIFHDPVIFYHTETLPDYNRVLEIFIRANEAGTRLSKSDLLLSTLISNWKHEEARQEIHGFVDRLNTGLDRDNDLDKDFVVKSCFFLCELPIRYNLKAFTRRNLKVIENEWPKIKQSLERCVRLVNRFGIDQNNLTSANALIPVAYYLHNNPDETLLGSSRFETRNASAIHRWIVMALLNGVFGGASDTMLAALRDVLHRHGRNGHDFPIRQLNQAIAQRGKSSSFTQEALTKLFEREYGEAETFLALTLLYDDLWWGSVPHHVDHIFPKKAFSDANLNRTGVPGDEHEEFQNLNNRLANLELLTNHENTSKSGKEFSEWIRSRSRNFAKRHRIPRDRRLYALRRFPAFIKRREALIASRLRSLFGN